MDEPNHDYWVVIKGYYRNVTEEEADALHDDIQGLGLMISDIEMEEVG
jgi:hypothetical protein